MTEVSGLEQLRQTKQRNSERKVLTKQERLLQAEWRRQAQMLAEICAPILKMSKKEYIASLPPFVDQPEETQRLFSVPLIVETRLGWRGLARAAAFATPFGYRGEPTKLKIPLEFKAVSTREFKKVADKIVDWKDDPMKFKTPKIPYTTWTSKGPWYLNQPAFAVRRELNTGLSDYYRGGTIFDAITLVIFHPEVVKGHLFDLVGSQVKNDDLYLPSLNWFGETPEFEIGFHGDHDPHSGSLICSRKIGT